MASIGCLCGNSIQDVSEPFRFRWHVYPEEAFSSALKCESYFGFFGATHESRTSAWICPKCHRLLWLVERETGRLAPWSLEDSILDEDAAGEDWSPGHLSTELWLCILQRHAAKVLGGEVRSMLQAASITRSRLVHWERANELHRFSNELWVNMIKQHVRDVVADWKSGWLAFLRVPSEKKIELYKRESAI